MKALHPKTQLEMKATTFICDHKMDVDILVEDLALMAGDIRRSGHDGVGMTVSRPLLQGDKDNNRMHSTTRHAIARLGSNTSRFTLSIVMLSSCHHAFLREERTL
jgi:hypothetical protein